MTLISKNVIMFSMKSKKRSDEIMNAEKLEDVKDTALKLEIIHSQSPTGYFYLKGWIDFLLQKEKCTQEHSQPPEDQATYSHIK